MTANREAAKDDISAAFGILDADRHVSIEDMAETVAKAAAAGFDPKMAGQSGVHSAEWETTGSRASRTVTPKQRDGARIPRRLG